MADVAVGTERAVDAPQLSVGQSCLYVPGVDHAFDRDPQGGYLYTFLHEDKSELTDQEIRKLERDKHGDLRFAKKLVTIGEPRVYWHATVTAVAGDAFDLAITDGGTGATLHYAGRKHDATKKPDTFHLDGE